VGIKLRNPAGETQIQLEVDDVFEYTFPLSSSLPLDLLKIELFTLSSTAVFIGVDFLLALLALL
jgi:hypothetical protein